ncbi:MAG: phenylalanine--tRNA ligase subunit beta [Candidatus Pacebacteria bacterium]|nr:phenylalanine--tRNA ligase subunit beta [Candidatus Paceibacterota bacterium]
MKVSYNWLQQYIPELPPADKLYDIFTYHLCEVESLDKLETGEKDDWIFDINILPDRACYLLSHQGVAKELASMLGLEFKDATPMYQIPDSTPTTLKVDAGESRRYCARIVRNIKIGPSPEWVKNHLESIGQRSINNIVDATNIVMHDCGQPCHAFDADKITSSQPSPTLGEGASSPDAGEDRGEVKITVRFASDGETMITLDSKELSLKPNDVVIADSKNVLALAGVKGGKAAEVDNNTKNIILEVANFYPEHVRRSKARHAIYTDSAKRFENGLSPELVDFAMMELSALIVEMCPDAVFEDIVDEYKAVEFKDERTIKFSADKVRSVLGVAIPTDEIIDILHRYDMSPTQDGENITIMVPALRLDLTGPHDIVEEIGRVIGYDRVVPKIPRLSFVPKIHDVTYKILAVRNKMITDGYTEVITYSFGDKGELRVLKSAEDKNYLRTNIADGLQSEYEKNKLNLTLLGIDQVAMFEIGTVFHKDVSASAQGSGVTSEIVNVAWIDKNGVQEKTLDEFCNQNNITVGDSYNRLLGDNAEGSQKFVPWSVYPFMTRDVAVWTSGEQDKEKLYAILADADLLVREPRLVDQFTKDNRTSYAYRLIFQSYDRTLTDEEVGNIMDGIYAKIAENTDWEVR